MLASLSVGGVETTQQVDARVKQLEEMLAVQEQKLAIERGNLQQFRKITEFHEGENLRIFGERQRLYLELQETKSRLENVEGDYRKLIGSYQKIDQENRRLERQIAEISKEALVAWKKVGTMQEQIVTRFREALLIGNGNGR